MSARKILLLSLCLLTILVAFRDSGAVMDIYSRRGAFSIGEALKRKFRGSDPFSRSIAHYTMGIIYDNESRVPEAIREYEAALKTDPGVSYIHTRLAADYLFLKKPDKALAEIDKALSLDPADLRPRFMAAIVYTSMGRYSDAQKEYEEALRVSPDSILALSSLADIYVMQRKMLEAASVYEKLIEKDKSSDILFFNLGVIYARTGKTEEAISSLKEAARLNGRYLEAYIGLGALYEMKKDFAAAIENYDKAIGIDPANIGVYHRLGAVLARAKRYDEALGVYVTLGRIDPNDPYTYIGWANAHLARKQADEAIEVLRKGAAAGIKDADLYTMLGYAHSLKDAASKEALKFYNMALELKPESPAAHFYMAVYYDKLKDGASAERHLREAARIDPGYADAYNYLGYMFAENGSNLDEAIKLVKKALEIEPDNGAFVDSLAWAYYKKGMLEEALLEIEKAVGLEPDDAEIRSHLEKIKESLKNRK